MFDHFQGTIRTAHGHSFPGERRSYKVLARTGSRESPATFPVQLTAPGTSPVPFFSSGNTPGHIGMSRYTDTITPPDFFRAGMLRGRNIAEKSAPEAAPSFPNGCRNMIITPGNVGNQAPKHKRAHPAQRFGYFHMRFNLIKRTCPGPSP